MHTLSLLLCADCSGLGCTGWSRWSFRQMSRMQQCDVGSIVQLEFQWDVCREEQAVGRKELSRGCQHWQWTVLPKWKGQSRLGGVGIGSRLHWVPVWKIGKQYRRVGGRLSMYHVPGVEQGSGGVGSNSLRESGAPAGTRHFTHRRHHSVTKEM